MLEVATSALPTGVFQQAMHWMSVAHLKAYDYIHGLRFFFFIKALDLLQVLSFFLIKALDLLQVISAI